ncbi:MAG: nucleotidyltransferase domain-containing protein [Oscillospiraceae bacterium]|jgi:predicted nucleotidyltransferase|nr:nucleotidyltransferase domain-containing protein [Oscillospiraceae bacterium]
MDLTMMDLIKKSSEVIAYLNTLPEVKSCALYGSIANGTADNFSDIDICIDVSGFDNGMFMKALPQLMAKRFSVI